MSLILAILIGCPVPTFAQPGISRGPANRNVGSGTRVPKLSAPSNSINSIFQGAPLGAPSLLGTLPIPGASLSLPESAPVSAVTERLTQATPASVNVADSKKSRIIKRPLNAADDDLPATRSESTPERRKRIGPRKEKRHSAKSQLEGLSLGDEPSAIWENGKTQEPIQVVPANKGRLATYLAYKRLQLSVVKFYLGNRLHKQYELLEDARDSNRVAPSAVRKQVGLFIEARTKGLAGRVYPLGLDILNRPALTRDAHALFNKFFDVDQETREAWEAYVLAAVESPRAKIPSQLKKALFVILQDAASIPGEELAEFFNERRRGLKAQSDQFLPPDAQEKMIQRLKTAASQAVLEINKTLSPGKRLVGISLLGSYVTRTARPDSDMDFHVISEDAAEPTRALFVDRLAEIWEEMGRTEELGAFQYALPTRASLIEKVYEKPGNLPYRVLSPYPEVEQALTHDRSSDRWSGADQDLYARLFELTFRSTARLLFLWWDIKNFVVNNIRAAWLYHGLQIETIRFFFGTRVTGLRTKYFKWKKETDGIVPAVKDLEGLLLHWRAEAYTGSLRPLGPEVADRRAVKEAGLRTWDKFYPKNNETRAAFDRYIARVERVAPPGRPSYFRKQIFQVFYETSRLEESKLVAHIDGMLDDSVVEAKLEYGKTMKPRVQKVFGESAVKAIKAANETVPYESEVVAVVLYGSYATGTPGASSDLDYMVVTRDGSKLALKSFADSLTKIWEQTDFKESPLGHMSYAVVRSRRLIERTHPEGYLVFSDDAGVVQSLSNAVPENIERPMPQWKRIRGRLFAEVWKLYLRAIYRTLDARDAVFGRDKSL